MDVTLTWTTNPKHSLVAVASFRRIMGPLTKQKQFKNGLEHNIYVWGEAEQTAPIYKGLASPPVVVMLLLIGDAMNFIFTTSAEII